MKITFIIKASPDIGYGHLFRSRALAHDICELAQDPRDVLFCVVGDDKLSSLLSHSRFPFRIFSSEQELLEHADEAMLDEFVIFDCLGVDDALFGLVEARAKWTVSISPIFNHLADVDLFFHRTRYHSFEFGEQTDVFMGFEYALIQHSCVAISAGTFKRNLGSERLSIAISMGGGDAANKSLQVLRGLRNLKGIYTIWLMLGEGYKHSYDELIAESNKSPHEIILAKTNSSMWRVLGLTSLLILPGGVTTYEAVYAGLPTINIIEDPSQRFLIQELLERGICEEVDRIDVHALAERVEQLNADRETLYKRHLNSKGVIDGLASERIFEALLKRHRAA